VEIAMILQVLSADDIRRALPMPRAVEIVKKAFIELSGGRAVVPPRIQLDVPEKKGTTLVMPGYLPQAKQMAVKIVSVFSDNPARGLPVINALVIVMDAETGLPACIMDGTALTALRTGAASGAATDLLARENARTAGVFGAGVQGRTQLEAVCAVRSLKGALVFDVRAEAASAFAEEMSRKLGLDVRVALSAAEAAGADIVCTATTAGSPVFTDIDIRSGTHINAVGVFKPHLQEIPSQTVARAAIVVDSREACLEEAGDILVPMGEGLLTEESIRAELGEVAAGLKPGRSSSEEVTFFKSVGVAVQDAAAAAAVVERARELSLGASIAI
jgi:ornithine cyclodeaminase/alanine dehydrogenase-like protein (mu-crystallin family)